MIRLAVTSLLVGGCFFTPDRPELQRDAGGSGDAPDGSVSMPDGRTLLADRNYVFVTKLAHSASLVKDPAVADGICKNAAATAGVPNAASFIAWVSSDTPSVHAAMKLTGTGWYRTDGLPFANTTADLLDSGRTYYPPRLDEDGLPVPDNTIVLTGTTYDGVAEATCSEEAAFTYGVPDGGHVAWTSYGVVTCSTMGRLYCFGTGKTMPVVLPPQNGLRAFLSDDTTTGLGGTDGLSAVCRNEAMDHQLNGNFVALAATSQKAANMQVQTDGRAWYRLDGVLVANNDLLAFEAPLDVTPTTRLNTNVYFGAQSPSATAAVGGNCNDWNANGGATYFGESARATQQAFKGQVQGLCDVPARVYCFETTATTPPMP